MTLPPAIPQEAVIECYKSNPDMTPQKWVIWACDCAERALPVFEARYPDDARPRQALDAARAWVTNPTKANRQATYDAAYAADAAAYAAHAAADAAAHAAHAAADAAYAAYAARATENLWQTVRLMEIYHA